MPRRRRQQRLERVLGAPALFATAYGNVGSSIYYALGVTAVFALGLTPLVFVIAGIIFAATAADLRGGNGPLPRGRRLVELRAARVQRARQLRRRVGADAQLRDHDLHLGVLRPALPLDLLGAAARRTPGTSSSASIVIVLLVALNIVGIQEAAKLNVTLAVLDFATQLLLVLLGFDLDLQPAHPDRRTSTGGRADLEQLRACDPGRDDRVHGDRDRLEPRRGGARPARNIPRAILMTAIAVFAIYFTLPRDRALGAARASTSPDSTQTLLGAAPGPGRLQERPCARRSSRTSASRPAARRARRSTWACSRRRSSSSPRTPGVIGASRITYAMASYRQLPEVFRRLHPTLQDAVGLAGLLRGHRLDHRAHSGEGRLPRNDVLVRRDALVHDRARVARRAARAKRPDDELVFRGRPNLRFRGIDWPIFALVGGLGTGLAWLVVVVQTPATRYAGLGWLVVGFATTSSTGGGSCTRR